MPYKNTYIKNALVSENSFRIHRAEKQDIPVFKEIRKDLPQVKIGDLIDVSYLVVEGGKERLQEFRGTVIAKKGVGISRSMTI